MSDEVTALINYIRDSGISYTISATTGHYISPDNPCSPHVSNSYHCRQGTHGIGLAIDVVGPDLRAIYQAFAQVRSALAELLGPGDPGHNDHVHVAVPQGTIIHWSNPNMTPAEAGKRLIGIVAVNGGYALLAEDGATYVFSDEPKAYKGGLRWDSDTNSWELR